MTDGTKTRKSRTPRLMSAFSIDVLVKKKKAALATVASVDEELARKQAVLDAAKAS